MLLDPTKQLSTLQDCKSSHTTAQSSASHDSAGSSLRQRHVSRNRIAGLDGADERGTDHTQNTRSSYTVNNRGGFHGSVRSHAGAIVTGTPPPWNTSYLTPTPVVLPPIKRHSTFDLDMPDGCDERTPCPTLAHRTSKTPLASIAPTPVRTPMLDSNCNVDPNTSFATHSSCNCVLKYARKPEMSEDFNSITSYEDNGYMDVTEETFTSTLTKSAFFFHTLPRARTVYDPHP